MAERVWQKFETNLKISIPDVDVVVLPKIKQTFLSLDINYLTSPECKQITKTTLDKISENKSKVYSHLLELRRTLKKAKKTKRKKIIEQDECEVPNKVFIKEENALIEEELKLNQPRKVVPTKIVDNPVENNPVNNKIREFNLFDRLKDKLENDKPSKETTSSKVTSKDIPKPSAESSSKSILKEVPKNINEFKSISKPLPTTSTKPKTKKKDILDDPPALPTKVEKQIEKLEILLKTTQAEIEKREEEELTLDDLDDENNSFILLDKLKTHCVKIYKTIAKLRKEDSNNLNKRYHKQFTFEDTQYKDLNKRIEKFVHSKKFPDYSDIRNILFTYSKEKKIAMSNQRISEFASDIFTNIGNKLKKLRIKHFDKYFGNHLTDQVKMADDPLHDSEILKRNLNRNYFEGKQKLDKILTEYCDKQYNFPVEEKSESDIKTDTEDEELDEYEEDDVSEETPVEKPQEESSLVSKEKEPMKVFNYGLDGKIMTNTKPRDDIQYFEPVTESNSVGLAEPVEVYEYGHEGPVKVDGDNVNVEETKIEIENSQENKEKMLQDQLDITNNNKSDTIISKENIAVPVKILKEEVPEEDLNQLLEHTFQFNIDQLKNKENGKFYNEVITLDSDDDDDDDGDNKSSSSSSSSNCKSGNLNGNTDESLDDRISGYSSKLDEIVYIPKRVANKEPIFISLDDSD